MKKLTALALSALAMIPSQAFAFDWVLVAKVTKIEGTYSPVHIPFQIDTTAGNCTAGTFLQWFAQGPDSVSQAHNYDTIMALLITAKSTGQQVTVYGDNNGCTVDYLYLG